MFHLGTKRIKEEEEDEVLTSTKVSQSLVF